MAIERVKLRVAGGGHNIPLDTIKRRYNNGIKNLINIFITLADKWVVIDNSHQEYFFIAENDAAKKIKVYHEKLWGLIKKKSNEKK